MEVVVDGFTVSRHVVLSPLAPRRTVMIDTVEALARLVRQISTVRLHRTLRTDPALTVLPSQESSSLRA